MSAIPSAQTTLVILLGASQHPNYPELDSKFGNPEAWESAFKQGAEKLQTYFINMFNLPKENLLYLFDTPKLPIEIYKEVQLHVEKFLDKITDVLIYYIGHGQVENKQLYLATCSIEKEYFHITCVKVEDLAQSLKSKKSELRYFYVFDCCFAECAIHDVQDKISSAVILCSARSREESIVLPDHRNTWFTEAFLQILYEGELASKKYLSFSNVADSLRNALSALDRKYNLQLAYPYQNPLPSPFFYRGQGIIADTPLFPNPAYREDRDVSLLSEGQQQPLNVSGTSIPSLVLQLPLPVEPPSFHQASSLPSQKSKEEQLLEAEEIVSIRETSLFDQFQEPSKSVEGVISSGQQDQDETVPNISRNLQEVIEETPYLHTGFPNIWGSTSTVNRQRIDELAHLLQEGNRNSPLGATNSSLIPSLSSQNSISINSSAYPAKRTAVISQINSVRSCSGCAVGIVGVLLIILGIFVCPVANVSTIQAAYAFYNKAQATTQGIVQSSYDNISDCGTTCGTSEDCSTTVTFTPLGQKTSFTTTDTQCSALDKGTRVEVLYDPNNPRIAKTSRQASGDITGAIAWTIFFPFIAFLSIILIVAKIQGN